MQEKGCVGGFVFVKFEDRIYIYVSLIFRQLDCQPKPSLAQRSPNPLPGMLRHLRHICTYHENILDMDIFGTYLQNVLKIF